VQKFQDFLEQLPHDVYRAKGLIWIAESDKRYVFHLVGKRFCLDEDARDGEKTNKLVLIGRNLDRAELRSRLEACLLPSRFQAASLAASYAQSEGSISLLRS
jgi:G3E family GTPase